jgi:hypothetical protein
MKPSVLAQPSQGPVHGQDERLESESESNTSTEAQENATSVIPPIVSVPPSPPVPPPEYPMPLYPPTPTTETVMPYKLPSIRHKSSFPENQSVSEDLLIGAPRNRIGIDID